ncbi:choice-of-anchor D domain-containing protein [Adhaeribacter swui]|uniref:Choice-of-anchor D domain-containing protein n=1 Tax=Adhaeribacter swui TaxID=2086471 RepID=A0A7G7GBK6_9BACT|nr:kelch repeat-containing protein [Adhaeribacter swui]QNF34540.1 choice-of-anchor D domain-containing protein [Adhaeribacter swui]
MKKNLTLLVFKNSSFLKISIFSALFLSLTVNSESKPTNKILINEYTGSKNTGSPASLPVPAVASSLGAWASIVPGSGAPTARHEASYVQAGNKFYLMGGRKIKPVQVFDLVKKNWVNKVNTPIELHHFQAISLDGLIYVVGAFTGSYPHEKPVSNIYIYNPTTNKWITGATIPSARRRGSVGVVVYNKKIYLVGGIKDGHWAGHVNWFDEYNPATNTWRTLPNAPRARDHFQAAVVNGKLYLAGGRRSSASTNQTFELTVPQVDVFEFSASKWTTLPSSSNIPTQRAGTATAVLGNELIIIGGESGSQTSAHKHTEALNVTTNKWRRLADLKQGRHGTQAIVNNNNIYLAAGCGNRGGTPELNTQEVFYLSSRTAPTGSNLTQSKLAAPTSVSFGTVTLNTTSTKSITLSNTTGNQAILISSVTKSGAGAFTVSVPYTLPFVLAPGKSVTLTGKFKPGITGSQTASVVIKHSGQGGSTTIAMSGSGVKAATRNADTENSAEIAFNNQMVAVYPNPVLNGQFTVNLPEGLTGEVPYSLVNQSGTILLSDKLNLPAATHSLPFNLANRNLNSGLYYLQITQGTQRYVVKIMLEK